MMRSLYSGISGLKNHQTRMDVIGNNVANVNTTGYKASRVIFQDIFSQTVSGGMANTGVSGGTNPMQIGLGIRLSSVDVMHTFAPFGRTDNAFDMMISGDGFFIVESPEGYYYTRAGNFNLDNEGYLVTGDGMYVMAYMGEPDPATGLYFTYIPDVGATPGPPPTPYEPPKIDEFENDTYEIDMTMLQRVRLRAEDTTTPPAGSPVDLLGFNVGDDGSINVMYQNQKITIGKIAVALFSNNGGLEKAGNSLYRSTASSGTAVVGPAKENGAGTIMGGGLEMSNVDLSTEFTDMIVTQRGFQANSRIITVSDTLLEELVNLKR